MTRTARRTIRTLQALAIIGAVTVLTLKATDKPDALWALLAFLGYLLIAVIVTAALEGDTTTAAPRDTGNGCYLCRPGDPDAADEACSACDRAYWSNPVPMPVAADGPDATGIELSSWGTSHDAPELCLTPDPFGGQDDTTPFAARIHPDHNTGA